MIKDYAGGYSTGYGIANRRPRQKVAPKSPGTASPSLMMKSIGVMVALALVAGVTSTIVYGMHIRSALDAIGSSSSVQAELLKTNQTLSVSRNELMTQESIKKAAGRLGLFPPTASQIRRP